MTTDQTKIPSSAETVDLDGLAIDSALHRFISEEALPGSGVDPERFWGGLVGAVDRFADRNRALLARRAELQAAIDGWHREHRGLPHDAGDYRRFLEEIGYLQPEGPDFQIDTDRIDPEIAEIAGPQLVVPVTNARYALNAANARWGSLYDALYGTDALGDAAPAGPYDPSRGARVIAWVRSFLDEVAPLEAGSHAQANGYRVEDGALRVATDEGTRALRDPERFAGYRGEPSSPSSILFRHHNLHVEIVVDRAHPVGAEDPAGVADVVIEAAVTTIVDFEDSVATVDAADKVDAYRNWLGLMTGDLSAEFVKGGSLLTRHLAGARTFVGPDGAPISLPGRALLLVRNVGQLITTDALVDRDGRPTPECLLDAMVTVLAALHDLRRPEPANSRRGSVYVVKPKMHGPEEVAFTDELFAHVEDAFDLPRGTVKIGLMDEERRTSLNLKECIRAARSRIAFINTGFLDRTGDEIHTSMEAGPMVRKAEMRTKEWYTVYEEHNVAVGLACGLRARAQIGKGMWAAPDRMAQMLAEKIGHPLAGANCAWVPSPTAATLHATHYHRVDVPAVQERLAARAPGRIDGMLSLPLAGGKLYGPEERREELENNAQGILGYLVRWIDLGIGCSKVPDINDVALMEDRATCRISSQHMANWLHHGVVDQEAVLATMRRMAAVVDQQNEGTPGYTPMAPGFDGQAFAGACDLVLRGADLPSGYTEPVLHERRRWRKAEEPEALD